MKRWTVVALIALITVAAASNRDKITLQLLTAGLGKMMGQDASSQFVDGLHLGLCGAGGPLPAPKASGPCIVVTAGERHFVFDAGTDGVRNLIRMGYPVGRIEAVFLTHFHSDHIDGLGELATLRWVNAANETPLPVFGPTGVDQIVAGFNMAYQLDTQYRHAHHGDTVAPLSGAGMVASVFSKPEPGISHDLIKEPNLRISAFAVDHSPVDPAVGYRVEYKDRSLVITGDTIKSQNIIHQARNVDLLAHEALASNLVKLMNQTAAQKGLSVLQKVTSDIPDYHATPMDAAETAKEAGVGHLLYYHIVPPLIIPGQESLFLNGADAVFENYTVGIDGLVISMPAGSREIKTVSKGL